MSCRSATAAACERARAALRIASTQAHPASATTASPNDTRTVRSIGPQCRTNSCAQPPDNRTNRHPQTGSRELRRRPLRALGREISAGSSPRVTLAQNRQQERRLDGARTLRAFLPSECGFAPTNLARHHKSVQGPLQWGTSAAPFAAYPVPRCSLGNDRVLDEVKAQQAVLATDCLVVGGVMSWSTRWHKPSVMVGHPLRTRSCRLVVASVALIT
jgi:hypothetical protein